MTFAAASPRNSVDTSPVTRAQSVLRTPDIIAPAVLPYAACLCGAHGLPLLLGSDGKQISYDANDKDCSVARRRAAIEALKLLRHTAVPGGRTASEYVDSALTDVDDFVKMQAARQGSDRSKSGVFGLPFILLDEVQPAYEQYEDCLKAQVSYSQVSIDTILQAFRQAMSTCRSVRDYGVAEAENALAKKGWDAATRAKAVESTFATADRSWLIMGAQFRDSLIAGTAKQKPHRN